MSRALSPILHLTLFERCSAPGRSASRSHSSKAKSGDEGYGKAEVTGGGVRLSEIDPKTMESKIHKGLFLCGEILDAFGPIGDYNFFWAWATGRAAGLGASRTQ